MLRIETEYWKYWMNNGSNRQHLVLSCSNFKTEQILSIRKQFENKIGNQFKREKRSRVYMYSSNACHLVDYVDKVWIAYLFTEYVSDSLCTTQTLTNHKQCESNQLRQP